MGKFIKHGSQPSTRNHRYFLVPNLGQNDAKEAEVKFPSVEKESSIHGDALMEVYKSLQRDLDSYNDGRPGSPRDFAANGRIERWALGDYPTTNGLSQTCMQAYQSINMSYETFLRVYKEIIDAIKRTVESHEQAEESNTRAVNAAYQE